MDSPTPPDPYQTSKTQAGFNTQTATAQQNLNMVDQTTPYGSLKYTQIGTNPDGTPKYQADTTLSGIGQQLFDTSNQSKLGIGNIANQLLGSGQGALSGKPLDLSWGATEANLDALGRKTLDPQFQQREAGLTSDLYNRGIRPGDQQYQIAMDQLGRDRGAAYDNLYLQGHQTAVNDLTSQYNSPLSTLSTLMTGSQPTNPTFQNTPQTGVQGVNYAGQVQQNYQDQLAANNAEMGGMFGLGGALGGGLLNAAGKAGSFGALFSDRRLKTDIKCIGTAANGLPVYEFNYVWGGPRQTGYMADDVEKIAPWAVGESHGFKTVDYSKV
jgi:hypothetical protein